MLTHLKSIHYLMLLINFLFQGCSHEITRFDSQNINNLTKFLIDNKTTRKEVVDQLGNPSKKYENDSILVYRVCDEDEFIALPNPKKRLQQCSVDLVLVFTSDSILKKHSLVKGIKEQ